MRAAARHLALAAVAVLMLAPLLWVFTSSLRPATEIFQYSRQLSWHTFVPLTLTLENYAALMTGDFPRAVFNTLIVAAATVGAGIIVNAAAGFAFAVFDFPGKRIAFILVMLTFMMPFESIVIPLYMVIRALGWTDTYQALVLPELANGLVIFLFRQFFNAVNPELYDAARIDGASWGRVFWSIALPLSWPTVITAGLMLFIAQWDAFFWPLVATSSPDHTLVQVAIARNMEFERANFGRLFSSVTIASLVAIVPFLFLQRFYIRTIVNTGMR
jgi:ABC-type glycerol-3-phosphate transport system permease component